MAQHSLEQTVAELDAAFNRGDLEAVLEHYEENAVMVLEPGRVIRGKAQLRQAFTFLLSWAGTARQIKTYVLQSDELALFISQWNFSATPPDGVPISRDGIATSVFRRGSDGRWRCVVDNSYGPAILE